VGNKQYIEALESHNIVIKPRNFLVFQGQVEVIATMNPKQRTVLLEKISGSGDLKEDYERLEKELEVSNEDMRKAFTKKKEMAAEEKEAKEDKKLADEYEKCQKDLVCCKIFLICCELNFAFLLDFVIYKKGIVSHLIPSSTFNPSKFLMK
jgi:chromosome segregation ATPase